MRRNGRRPKSLSEELLRSHVERFNEGVRSGDYGPMLEQFADDAELAFEGVSVGPFRGKTAIAQAMTARVNSHPAMSCQAGSVNK